NQPLKAKEFLQHPMYGRLYSIVSGQEALKAMVLKYVSAPEAIIGNDISKRFDPNRLAIWDESLEKEFATQDAKVKDLKPDPNRNTQEHVDIKSAIEDTVYEPVKPRFDIEGFFDSIPNIVYPLEFRTPQIKRLIEEVGTLFDVDFETMKRFMINSSNFETKKFDTKRFVYQLERQYGAMKVDEENPYDVDPVSFIRYKQGYEYVVGSDQNLVKSLTTNFGFSNQVINFLVEYVLKVNDNNLNRAYVEKIASTWKRNNVETLEDAKNQIKEKPKKFEKKKVKYTQEMPEYTQDEALSEDEQEALKASIQAMLEEGE
ncbi:MAG: DnaD domain protein, partial [Erysipelothrix sp.]|nr:DnaD domain protein [Erysipelothrix sp.]